MLEQPRRCVFAGTVNADDYLRDETGNRRFWPVRCSVAKLNELERDRDQLWAEAVRRFKDGAKWWLDDARLIDTARQEQSDRVQHDPWHELIENYVAVRNDVSTTEILTECLHKDQGRWDRKDQMRVAAILRILAWERRKLRLAGGGNRSERRYYRLKQ